MDEIHTQPFGNTGLRVPPLVFGATSLGNLFREVPEQVKADIIGAWLEAPWSPILIDSAGKYGAGLSLEVIGRELNRRQVSPGRVLISNKLGWRRVPLQGLEPTFEPGAWFGLRHDAVQDISYDGILRCWHEGNELLQGRAAQIVSVHDPDEYLAAAADEAEYQTRFQDLVDAYRALTDLKAEGKVAAVGVGSKTWTTVQDLSRHCQLDWVMLANSFTIMEHPSLLLDFINQLAEQNVAVINSALFHGGFLLGGDFFDYRKVDPANEQDQQRLAWRDTFNRICEQFEVTPFEVGLAFGRAHPGITAVALSSSRADRVPVHVDAICKDVPNGVWSALCDAGLIDPALKFLPK